MLLTTKKNSNQRIHNCNKNLKTMPVTMARSPKRGLKITLILCCKTVNLELLQFTDVIADVLASNLNCFHFITNLE